MAEKKGWVKVSFSPKENTTKCKITFRSPGQIILSAETMVALGMPQYINLYTSTNKNSIAMQAGDKNDPDAVRVSTKSPAVGSGAQFANKSVYRWICELLDKEDVTISMNGEAVEKKLVFDLKQADIREKRTRKQKE